MKFINKIVGSSKRFGMALLAGASVSVAQAQSAVPTEIQGIMDNVDEGWTWAKSIIIGVLGFSMLVWVIRKARR